MFHLASRLVRTTDIKLLVVLLNPGQLADELRTHGVEVLILDERVLSGLALLRQFYKTVKEYRPDIIHTHRTKENVIGGLVAKLNGCKSVRTVHGASEFAFNAANVRQVIFRIADKLAGYLFQQKIIAVSDELKQKLLADYPSAKLTIIPNCVDVSYIENKANEFCDIPVDTQLCNIAFVGRFVPVKRVDIFYDIAKKTIKTFPEKKIFFHMLGDGPLQGDIARKIAADGLEERILLHGFVSNTAPLLKRMSLLMFTSDHEGLPMTLLEAMALGVPVLSRNLPSIRAVLCNGECGYVLESDDIQNYVEVISSLADDDTDAKRRALSARTKIDDEYNIEINVEKYLKLYKDVVTLGKR